MGRGCSRWQHRTASGSGSGSGDLSHDLGDLHPRGRCGLGSRHDRSGVVGRPLWSQRRRLQATRGSADPARASGFPRPRSSHTRGRARPRRGSRSSRAANPRRRPRARRVGIAAGGRIPHSGVARVPSRLGDSESASRHGPESRPASWTRRTRRARSHTSTTPSDVVRTPRLASRRRARTSRTTPCASTATSTTFAHRRNHDARTA